MGRGVPGPGQVLQLVGAEHAVGADQAVGAGEARVRLAGVDEQQDEREQPPRGQRRQQRPLDARDPRARSCPIGGQGKPPARRYAVRAGSAGGR